MKYFEINLGSQGFGRLGLHWTICKEAFYVFFVFLFISSGNITFNLLVMA